MENNRENKNDTFSYTYSAKQQEELKTIRQKYIPREENKMEQLQRLDKSVTKRGTIVSLIVGIISALVMGTGMSLIMAFTGYFILGIVIGVVGMVGVAAAYPVFVAITKKEREKIAPQILKLTDELMQQK